MLKKLLQKSYRNTKKLLKIKKNKGKKTTQFDDLETIDYNNDTSRSDLNDIISGTRKNINAQKTAKKIPQKYKKLVKIQKIG